VLSLSFLLTVQAWVDDTASLTCLLCVEKFTYSNRRHHCRTCGALVCDHCSSKRLTTGKSPGMGASSKNKRNSGIPVPPSPKDGSSTKKPAVKEGDRVCDGCFNKLAHECFLWQQAVQRVRRAQEKLAAEAPELLLNEASLTGQGRSMSFAAGGASPGPSGVDRARNVATETRRALEQRGERLQQASERSDQIRQVTHLVFTCIRVRAYSDTVYLVATSCGAERSRLQGTNSAAAATAA
jgi:DNA-directed RNA polymerase subunit RPC12/RpoP